MNIIGQVKSWENNRDCFGYEEPHDIDHIYPRSLGGSNTKINKQSISRFANESKKDKTKGKIDAEWRFAILKLQSKEEDVWGKMFIRKKDWDNDEWKEVIPVII